MITVQPVTSSLLVTTLGNLTCCATGIPPPNLVWIKDSSLVNSSISLQPTSNPSTVCSSLLLENLKLSDAASYRCNATNDLAEVITVPSDVAELTVLRKHQDAIQCML